MKDKFFYKIVKRDYNNRLEEILSKKNFTEEVKNTLLTMFYKIENGYKDYKTVKRETFDKKEYMGKLTTIIENCEKIEFVAQNDKNIEKVDSVKKEIRCFPKENRILYSLAKIQKRNIVVKYIDTSIEKALSCTLNIGNNMNIVEPLRDFNGFSWNIVVKDIENLYYNLIYQNMIFLIGNKFIDKWVNNYEPLVDYFELFQSEIEKKYGKKIKENIVKNINILSIRINEENDENFKKEIEIKIKKLEEEKIELENRELYLINIAKNKKQKEKDIKCIDKIINDKNLIEEEFKIRNEKLPINKKIFSIRILKNQLKKEREEALEQINKYNFMMNPKNFLEKRNLVNEKLESLDNAETLEKLLVNLQKEIIKCMYIDVKEIEDKNKLINMVYKYRYYNFLPVDSQNCIKDIKELKRGLNRLTKSLINKMIKMKIINEISNQENINYEVIEKLILSKRITLEDIGVKITKEKEKIYLTIYDEEIEEGKVELKNVKKEDFKIRFNKKIKIFI